MIKLIVFDWDDVFTLNSIKGFYKCYHQALEGVGVHFSPEDEDRLIKDKWGAGYVAQLEHLLSDRPGLVDKAVKIYQENYFGNTFVDCLSIIPGTQEFLMNVAKRYKLAVATGAHPKVLKSTTSRFNIPDVFAEVISIYDIDDMKHAKPHPHILNKIMKLMNVRPEETVMVGMHQVTCRWLGMQELNL